MSAGDRKAVVSGQWSVVSGQGQWRGTGYCGVVERSSGGRNVNFSLKLGVVSDNSNDEEHGWDLACRAISPIYIPIGPIRPIRRRPIRRIETGMSFWTKSCVLRAKQKMVETWISA